MNSYAYHVMIGPLTRDGYFYQRWQNYRDNLCVGRTDSAAGVSGRGNHAQISRKFGGSNA